MTYYPQPNQNYKILLERDTENFSLRKAEYMPGNWNSTHFHENARFVFVLRGSFVERYERKRRFCQPFTGIFRPPLEKHSEVYDEGVVCLSVDILPFWIQRLQDYSVKLDKSNDVRNQSITYLINKICGEMIFDDNVSSLAIDTLLTEIALEMYRGLQDYKSEKLPRWIDAALEYIHENFSSNLTLNEIASAANVHPAHLARVFRNTRNCTIAEYIRRLRIESAREMLINSDLTLAQISSETGFSDQSHFTKVFKRLTNKTPREFKQFHKIAN